MTRSFLAVSLTALLACLVFAQSKPTPVKNRYFLESWIGQPGKSDQTDHKPVGAGNVLACEGVTPQDGTVLGCHVKFENGGDYDLTFRQSISSPKTDVAYLTCNVNAPTVKTADCKLSVTVLK